MRVYASDHVSSNGSGPRVEDDDDFTAQEEDSIYDSEEYDYSQLFDAASYSEFIKTKPNSNAQKYEKRVAAMMKAGLIGSLQAHQFPDAATFLKHGPGFAKAAGNLAAEDARVARIVEMLTAPDSPYVVFAMVAMPFVAQLFRNHQDEVNEVAATWRQRRAQRKQARRDGVKPQTVKQPPIVVHLFKREFKLPIRIRLRLPKFRNIFGAFLSPTQHPQEIAAEVFQDEKVRLALHKMGIYPRRRSDDDG